MENVATDGKLFYTKTIQVDFKKYFSWIGLSYFIKGDFFLSLTPPLFSSFMFVSMQYLSVCLSVTPLNLSLFYGQFVLVFIQTAKVQFTKCISERKVQYKIQPISSQGPRGDL